jgi:hypothetical protein
MKLSIKSVVAGASTLAVTGAMVIGYGGVALAATPPYDPSANGATQGTLSFYNAAGQQIVSGPINTPPAYVLANTDIGRAGDNKATVYAATPKEGTDPSLWLNGVIASAKTYPSATAPGILLNNAHALGRGILSWFDPSNAASWAANNPNTNTTASWQNLYQVRILTSGPGQAVDPSRYASASIQIDTTAGTWTEVYPTVSSIATTTTLTDPGAQTKNAPFNLAGTVAPAGAPGSVELFDGASSLGTSPVAADGTFSKSVTLTTNGSHTLKAVFTATPPTGGLVGYSNSTSGNVVVSVHGSGDATNTALGVDNTTGQENTPVTMTATVTDTPHAGTVPVGSVKFFNNGTLIAGSQTTVDGTGKAVYTNSGGFPSAGNPYSFTAVFTPTDATDFGGSTGGPVTANYTAAVCADGTTNCIDKQTFKVKVPAGGLVISTPYTTANPFDLGTMALNAAGTQFHAGAQFPKAGDSPLTISDTRAGDQPWTAYLYSNDFTNGGTGVIDSSGLSYTNVTPSYIAGNALNAATKPVVTNDVASVKGDSTHQHQFASAAHGAGSVFIDGRFDLVAPSSVQAGDYTGTVTFTVS